MGSGTENVGWEMDPRGNFKTHVGSVFSITWVVATKTHPTHGGCGTTDISLMHRGIWSRVKRYSDGVGDSVE